MSFGSGSLTLAAKRSGTRTVIDRVRYDGISRCSRAFKRGDAALVILSQLGPGVVRGDTVTTRGTVHAGAHLIVTAQTATRLMGGVRPARADSAWLVEDDAVLELVGEPLVAGPDARYESNTAIELQIGACVLMTDVAGVPAGAAVRLRTSVTRGGRELYYDAIDAGAAAPRAVGTFAAVGITGERAALVVDALDAFADRIGHVRIGVGGLAAGAFARILGPDIWSVRSACDALRAAAWSALETAGPAASPLFSARSPVASSSDG